MAPVRGWRWRIWPRRGIGGSAARVLPALIGGLAPEARDAVLPVGLPVALIAGESTPPP